MLGKPPPKTVEIGINIASETTFNELKPSSRCKGGPN